MLLLLVSIFLVLSRREESVKKITSDRWAVAFQTETLVLYMVNSHWSSNMNWNLLAQFPWTNMSKNEFRLLTRPIFFNQLRQKKTYTLCVIPHALEKGETKIFHWLVYRRQPQTMDTDACPLHSFYTEDYWNSQILLRAVQYGNVLCCNVEKSKTLRKPVHLALYSIGPTYPNLMNVCKRA